MLTTLPVFIPSTMLVNKLHIVLKHRRDRATRLHNYTSISQAIKQPGCHVKLWKRRRRTFRIVYDQPHIFERSLQDEMAFGIRWQAENSQQYWAELPQLLVVSAPLNLPEVHVNTVYDLQPSLARIPLDHLRVAMHKSILEFKCVFSQIRLHQILICKVHRCWDSVAQAKTERPGTVLPRELEVVMDDYGLSTTPTHYIALYATPTVGPRLHRHKISVIPVHGFILAMYCSNIRKYLPSKRIITAAKSCRVAAQDDEPEMEVHRSALRLPVLSIAIPDPSSFMVLLQYFYTGNLRAFCLNAAPYLAYEPREFPLDMADKTNEMYMRALSCQLAENYPPPELREYWQNLWWLSWNMVALGVSEPRLWAVLNVQTLCLQRAAAIQKDQGMHPTLERQEFLNVFHGRFRAQNLLVNSG